MQFTIPAEIKEFNGEDETAIDGLMDTQCSAGRSALNLLIKGKPFKSIMQILQDRFPLNWRYCEHTAREAEARIESQRELLPLYLEDTQDRIREVEKKLAKVKSEKKRESLRRQLAKLKKRKRFYEEHIKGGTIPKVVFGGRGNFEALMKGKLSKEEWRELRNNHLYSIGQANQKGNANLRILKLAEGEYGLQMRFIEGRNLKVGKDGRKLRYKGRVKAFKLYVPAKFQPHMDWVLEPEMAYSVRIIKEDGRYFVHISFEINNTPLAMIPERVTAIDPNPEGFAVAVVGRDGNLHAHRLFRDNRLIHASEEKRDNVVGVLVRELIEFAEGHHATVFIIENLKIRNHRNFGRRVNRIVYAFMRRKFKETLLARCWELGYPVFAVNQAYTSILGKKKYAKRLGLSPHEAAALVIGRRFHGHGEKLPEATPITIKVKAEAEKGKRIRRRGKRGEGEEDDRKKIKVPIRYVWSTIYGYLGPADPYRAATDGRKGSGEQKLGADDMAVFTGHPAGLSPPRICEGVRKGWGLAPGNGGTRPHRPCRGNRRATGDGGKPASIVMIDGRFEAKSFHDT